MRHANPPDKWNATSARLRAFLAGELPTIKRDRSITIRVPEDFIARATAATDQAAAPVRGRRAFGANLSVVIRFALLEGLDVLERRYGMGSSG